MCIGISTLNLSAPIIIDKTLAVVNDEIITLSNVTLFYQLHTILNSKNIWTSNEIKKLPLDLSQKALKTYTEKLMIIELLFQELKKFNFKSVKSKAAITQLKAKIKGEDTYLNLINRLLSSENAIKVLLVKKSSAELFINSKINRENLLVTDEEINSFITKNNLKNNKKSRDKAIRAIKDDKNDNRISTFIKKLLERNNVKYITDAFK